MRSVTIRYPPTRLLYCESVDGSEVDDVVAAVTTSALDRLRAQGVEIVETGPIMPEVFKPFLLLFYGGMVPAYRHLMGTDAFAAVTPGLQELLIRADELLTPDSIEDARKIAQACSVKLAAAMEGFDALVTPATIGQTPVSQGGGFVNGKETPAWVGNTFGFNVTKRPGGVTCAGFAPDGMPLALQIIGITSPTSAPSSSRPGLSRCSTSTGRAVPLMTQPSVRVTGHDHVVLVTSDPDRALAWYPAIVSA